MSDEPQSPPPATDAPQQSAPDAPPPPPPPPPADFGTQDSMAGQPPLNFGEQLMTRGGLPKDLETRIRAIETKKE